MNKEIKIQEHGNYLYGSLDGVDFIPSGSMEGKPYGASVKLKFVTRIKKVKKVKEIDVSTISSISQTIKIPTTDELLPSLALKYNEHIGKDLLINYATADNNIFVVNGSNEIRVLT